MPLPLTDPRPDPPNRSARLVFSGTYGGATWANVMWLFLTGSGEITVTNLNALAHQAYLAYVANILNHLSNTTHLLEASVTLWNSPDVIGGIDTGDTIGGVGTGNDTPASTAAVISWAIADRYRGGHPRTYVPGITTTGMASVRTLSSGLRSGLETGANAFHTAIESISGVGSGITLVEHGIISFQHDGEWRTPPLFRRINSAAVHSRLDSQRRRLGREV